jgi:hypothetical protein
MYSDSDLDAAVEAGVLTPAAVAAFRTHVAGASHSSLVDEEHFRLVTGFNDIFVTIASVLLLGAVGWIGSMIYSPVGPAAVAAVAWGLAEYFTRQRRMALPSILLLLAFVGGIFGAVALALMPPDGPPDDRTAALFAAIAAAVAAGGAWLHWRRFQVPITVAAGAAAVVALALGLMLSAVPDAYYVTRPMMLAAGIAVFLFAMRWDMADPERQTRRSDVAFWLHLLSAPLIVHPIFWMLGLLDGDATPAEAVVVILLYVALGVVALAIDRRALMVSSLVYVLYALSTLFREFGAVNLNFALTALIIGSALLLLSAFWHKARALIVTRLPPALQRRLPPPDTPMAVRAA